MPAGLIGLSAIPLIAGASRMTELAGGAVTADNARFFAAPVPVMLHIVSVTLYCFLGAFQFAPGFRRRRPRWHRFAGRVLVPAGLVVAVTGMWMTVFSDLPESDGALLGGVRLVVGTAMAVFLGLGLAAVLRRDFGRHRAWMMRAYAIALGAGTQALTQAPWFLLVGEPGQLAKAMLMTLAWVINLGVAEWIIRRPSRCGG